MVKLKFKYIKDVDAGKQIPNYKNFCKNHNTSSNPLYTKCLYLDKARKYHGWSNLDNLKEGKVAQCGYKAGNCNTKTLYGIGGYRNTCPIAGINGDYPCPSKLQISGFNFKDNKITNDSVIKSITISFKHRMSGVDTGSQKEYYGDYNSPNFGSKPVSIYFTNGNTKVSETIKGNKPKNTSDKKYTSITCTFKKVKISDALSGNFALNIEYDTNLNGNPGIIYLKDLVVDIDYEDTKKIISAKQSTNKIYTSTVSSCAQTLTQTVTARYSNKENTTSLSSKIQVSNKPKNVTVSPISVTNSTKTFLVTDTSGIAGKKGITYNLSNETKTKTTIYYEAILRPLPEYVITKEYKSHEDYNPLKNYIIFKNGCVPGGQIKIYVDSVDATPIILNVANQNNPNNLLDDNAIRLFHNEIKDLSCGTHTLYIDRGQESSSDILKNKVTITISPMNFKFYVRNNDVANEEENRCGLTKTDSLIFCQSKNNETRYGEIIITRIDDEPMEVIPKILIADTTQPNKENSYIENVEKNEEKTWEIDKYYAGQFSLTIKDAFNSCSNANAGIFNIDIISSHKQNYDYLFTRGQDGTTFDFDYLVAWEGDNIKEPLTVDSIDLKNSFDSLSFCSDNSQTGLSEINTVKLRIRNKTEELLENIKVELNVLKLNDDEEKEVTTEEWVSSDGIFNQFYSLFYEYNIGQESNIEINNLTPDNDLIDEENVYLKIKKIEAEDSITILLPYRSTVEKTIFLQYLLFEEPVQINSLSNCNSVTPTEDSVTDIKIDVYDSMLTDLSIEGNTDLLLIDPRYPCPTECYTTVDTDENGEPVDDINTGGITYKITNIDTNDFLNQYSTTQIINSEELIPYAYIVDGNLYNLLDQNNNIIEVDEERYQMNPDGTIFEDENHNRIKLPNKIEYVNRYKEIKKPISSANINAIVSFPQSETISYTVKTNKNGIAHFFIPIPVSLNQSYTIQQLLENVVTFTFEGNEAFNESNKGAQETSNTQNTFKNSSFINYIDNYRKYKPGETADILVVLEGGVKTHENYFIFHAELGEMGHSDEVTILYKICNLENNEGIFKTTFKTNDKKLIKNEVSQNIYAGINTNIDLKTNIEKKVVENRNINIINISVSNKEKENYDVEVQTNLGEQLSYPGKYDFLEIDIENGDYSIIEKDNNIYVSWMIGKMNPFESEKGVIRIKAQEIGLSDIKVNCYDYLHPKNSEPISVKNSNCVKCEEQTKWKLEDSKWTEIDGIMYKLGDDGIYRRKINGEWVDKE